MSLFQRLARIFSPGHQIPSSSASPAIEMPLKTRPSDIPALPLWMRSSISATVLSCCQILITGPTGMEKVVDLQQSAALPLWLYLIARTTVGDRVQTSEILRDVYGYRDTNKEQTEDPKARILNRFRYHCRLLRNLFNDAQVAVGLPKTDLLERRHYAIAYWSISSEIRMSDLPCFHECHRKLSMIKRTRTDAQAYQDCCTSTYEHITHVAHEARLPLQIREVLIAYHSALEYLATRAHQDAERVRNPMHKFMQGLVFTPLMQAHT